MTAAALPAALWGFAVAAALFGAVWAASVVRRDASLVDRFWGLGFVVLAWWYVVSAGAPGLLAAGLASAWGLRLSGYITWRNRGKGEDRRYAVMRERHGRGFALRSLFTVFLLQALLLWVIAFPLFAAARGETIGGGAGAALATAGAAVWLVGFAFESAGDFQLARFKRDPTNRGRVLDRGLWRYTRHPNYFGDILVWWGLYLVACAHGGWWTVFAPVLMTVFLARVSGVTLLERQLRESKPGYADYVRRTSALVPWPPRRGAGGEDSGADRLR